MSNFYARYVPQTKEQLGTLEATAPLNGSTKRKRPEQDIPLREPKKTRSSSVTEVRQDDFGIKRFVPKKEKLRSAGEEHAVTEGTPPQVPIQQPKSTGYQVLEKYRVTGVARKNISDSDVQIRRPVREDTTAHEDTQALEPAKEPKPKKTKKKRRHHTQDGAESAEGVNGEAVVHQELPEDGFKKHGAVRDRFKKAKKISDLHHDEAPPQNVPKREVHGLEPLPQPPEVLQPDEPPTYSTLPPWLAKADLVAKNDETTFESLGLSDTVLANLKSSGLTRAMPIQSSVIPLLSKGTSRHDGDLAVAAATGSGKTLAYIIPLVETLKGLAITKLRVVIVVPTRELVKQVQETFNMYAEGTNLRAAIALGSKSVKEEAESLVESYEAYDPAAYEEQQSRKVNWTAFSLEELFDRMKDGSSPAPNHVTRYRSRADVLICTPGRLVEHLQTTKGFNLDNVQWLVIDEVDRLLNESYQEWLEVVMPALESRQATELRDKVLTSMGMDLLPRHVRTVILSATMTQDLSKLNSLNLHNPRLLVLEGEQGEELKDETHARGNVGKSTPDLTGAFKMPTTLTETTVLVGDGSDKPLHLLDLLRNQIASAEKPVTNGTIVQKSDASSSDSSDESSSSDSDSESSTRSPMSHENTMPPVKTPQYASTLIFTRSTESAPRLSRLLCILDPLLTSQVAVLTRSTTSSASSRKALKSFRAGTVSILITTDRAARGLDVPNIQHVINYDVPSSVQFYVHRVGRTARAGKEGKAWTLLAHREGRWFDKEIAKGEQVRRRGKVSKVTLEGVGKDKDIRKRYEDALKQLGEEVEGK